MTAGLHRDFVRASVDNSLARPGGLTVLGTETRFVLSTSGHIAVLINPPGKSKASYQASDDVRAVAGEWQRTTATRQRSWWLDYASWLAERSGGQVPAPPALGRNGFRVLEPALGSYVRAARQGQPYDGGRDGKD